ncbi:CapA family protein [Neobacillus piezotolerans]|uniref:CapA family protein n=1 Tax=Neobacillus piezotolerans TaxID=2259171 RepID=UPI0015F1A93F|nr:CapA family protein [Neobacillus piezotolerans]
MKEFRIDTKLMAAVTVLAVFLTACSTQKPETMPAPTLHKDRQFAGAAKEIVETATVGAIGDILIHDHVYNDAKTANGYDFNPMFEPVKGMLQAPDILTANQESPVGGTELGVSSYPNFNSPFELSEAVMKAGVDIVSTANNHALDKGFRGINAQIGNFNKIGLPFTGTAANKESREKITVLTRNGIRLAFLSYTYGTNGIPIPRGMEFAVNLIDRELMKKDIERAKRISDAVIVSVHWGNEYQRIPTNEQKSLAAFLADQGVDIIFGSHPHVLQPMEWIKRKDGKRTFVVYSLGNFLSAQIGDYKDIGGLVTLKLTKTVNDEGTKVEVGPPSFQPTFVYRKNRRDFRVIPIEKAGQYGISNAKKMNEETLIHMNQWLR